MEPSGDGFVAGEHGGLAGEANKDVLGDLLGEARIADLAIGRGKTRSTCRLTRDRNAVSDPSRAYDLTRSRSVGMVTVFISYQDCRTPSKPNTVWEVR